MRIVAFAGDVAQNRAEDRPRRVVIPVVEDLHEQVSVAARQLVLEEITGHELDPLRQLALRLRDHVRQLEQDAARAGLLLEQRLQEVAAAAGDVGDLLEPREVVGPEDPGDLRVGLGRHRLVEDAGDVRVRRHVREEASVSAGDA